MTDRSGRLALATIVLGLALAGSASADLLLLKSGGRLQGEVHPLVRDGDEPVAYVVRMDSGVRIRVEADQVRRVEALSEAEQYYQRLLPEMPDTAAGHWTMASWCQKYDLRAQHDFHLQQVLRHDPNHADARRSLGYEWLDGQWIKAEEWMREQGYVRYKGQWRTPQQVAVAEKHEQIDQLQKEWRSKLRRWRSWLGGRRSAEAEEAIRGITDGLAVPALTELLSKESNAAVREMYVDVLGHLPNPAATTALIQTSLYDPDVEVRVRSLEKLKERGRRQAIRAYIRALSDSDNVIVNRAGAALKVVGDSTAILPLIDALVTRHVKIVQPAGGNVRPTFGSSSSGAGLNGLSVGGGPKKVTQDVQNRSVLEALVELTGQNFRYAIPAWKQWHLAQNTPQDLNLRRDP